MAKAVCVPRYTLADLERFPDDGNRYELLDGVVIRASAPSNAHQIIVNALEFRLMQAVWARVDHYRRAMLARSVARSGSRASAVGNICGALMRANQKSCLCAFQLPNAIISTKSGFIRQFRDSLLAWIGWWPLRPLTRP